MYTIWFNAATGEHTKEVVATQELADARAAELSGTTTRRADAFFVNYNGLKGHAYYARKAKSPVPSRSRALGLGLAV